MNVMEMQTAKLSEGRERKTSWYEASARTRVRLLAGRWGGGRGLVKALGAALLIHPLAGMVAVLGAALGFGLARDTLVGGMLGMLAGLGTIVVLAVTQNVSPWVVPGSVLWSLLIMAGFQDSFRRAHQRRGDNPRRLPD